MITKFLITKFFSLCLGHIAPGSTGGQTTPHRPTNYLEHLYVPDTVRRTGDRAGNKVDQVPAFKRLSFYCRDTDSKPITK